MARSLRDLPIKSKLMLVILLTSSFALFLMGTALIIYERVTFRRALAVNIGVLAQIPPRWPSMTPRMPAKYWPLWPPNIKSQRQRFMIRGDGFSPVSPTRFRWRNSRNNPDPMATNSTRRTW